MKTTPQFAVTYGRLNFSPDEEGLDTVFLGSIDEVKELAGQFIHVIPDDLPPYKKDIKKWNGTGQLLIVHQDDDSFYFSAVAIQQTTDLTKFSQFCEEFNHDDGDEDDDS